MAWDEELHSADKSRKVRIWSLNQSRKYKQHSPFLPSCIPYLKSYFLVLHIYCPGIRIISMGKHLGQVISDYQRQVFILVSLLLRNLPFTTKNCEICCFSTTNRKIFNFLSQVKEFLGERKVLYASFRNKCSVKGSSFK